MRYEKYYAYPTVEDRNGVIAPWYQKQNGQLDYRVRIAAETLKRYPWADTDKALSPAPHFIYNSLWNITSEGEISIPESDDWMNGDLGQRAAYLLSGLVDYYRYSGDPAAIAMAGMTADVLIDHCLTPPDHPWPGFLISVPTKGKPYGKTNPDGMIQIDITAEVGIGLLRTYQMTGNEKYLNTVKNWADLFAEKCNYDPQLPPWNRYANPEAVKWSDLMTGGVVFILEFLDEMIRFGYTGENQALIQARDCGRRYLKKVLIPRWTGMDTWGRNYWDWPCEAPAENVTEFVARYLMDHPDIFPDWKFATRNILTIFINRTGVAPESNGDTYSGAWAYPEGPGCCGRSLWYGPMELAIAYAQYAVLAEDEWAREIARRHQILATYDCHETGVVEDNIDGGQIVSGSWFKIAHPMALKHILATMAWLPDLFGAARENHIMRSTSVITHIQYGKGNITYKTFDAPINTYEVLRLSFAPDQILADGSTLSFIDTMDRNGYTLQALENGDYLVQVRHDGLTSIEIHGNDPQTQTSLQTYTHSDLWKTTKEVQSFSGQILETDQRLAELVIPFEGNQIRLLGQVGPDGGLADLHLDGVKQLVGIDCWNPEIRHQQVLYYRNGLENGTHELKIVVKGEKNLLSLGNWVRLDSLQTSTATTDCSFGEGGGPTGFQRMIFGYPGTRDYVDKIGNEWKPATEWILRSGHMRDSVATSWWTERRQITVLNTDDPELYRYGAHAPEFWANLTVGPGTYHVRVKLLESRLVELPKRLMDIHINGTLMVKDLDIEATSGGLGRPCDLVFNEIQPLHGIIEIRFSNKYGGEAICQAIEIGPGQGTAGVAPVCKPQDKHAQENKGGNLLINPGFEEGVPKNVGSLGQKYDQNGWKCLHSGVTQSYIWAESEYVQHPDWGLPRIHSGKDALRTHSEGGGNTVVYQEVSVAPGKTYEGSVWVVAVNLDGKGFGSSPGDSAGLRFQELASDGTVIQTHPLMRVHDQSEYTQLKYRFSTNQKTAMVRYLLETSMECPYTSGHVTYDDCSLIEVIENTEVP